MTTSPSDFELRVHELVERLNTGETQVLSEFWGLFGDHIRRRARTRLREFGIAGKAESMDICNTVLLDMIKQQSLQIQKPSDVLAYFCRAVDNQVRSLVRALLSEKRDIRREINLELTDSGFSPTADSPSLQLIHTELMEMVASFLGDQGSQFVKLYLENHSWQEIGAHLNCSPDSARMRWNRAIERLKVHLEQHRRPEDPNASH